jgi:hypothetical protein
MDLDSTPHYGNLKKKLKGPIDQGRFRKRWNVYVEQEQE